MRNALLLSIVLASTLSLDCESDSSACARANYSECGSPLPATQRDGQPWPTFSAALAGACEESQGYVALRGVCADGKRFITREGLFVGDTRYFQGETLVGVSGYTDVGGAPCQCPFERFEGTLQTVRCEAPTVEALCGSRVPEDFAPPFSQGNAFCECK